MRSQHWPTSRMPAAAFLRAEPPNQALTIDQLVLRLGNVAPLTVVMLEREKKVCGETALISEADINRVLDHIEASSQTP